MSFSTNWDINRYRADYESDEHWELRRAFIEEHKDKFPEDEIVCLAQVFTNIEFLGCRYPAKTMQRVALLSKDVAAKFREARSGRLKRTFVGASDAASAKAKGRGSQSKMTVNQNADQKKGFPTLQSSFRKQETSTEDETSTSSEINTKKQKLIVNLDSDSDDGEMARPSFATNPLEAVEQSTKNFQQNQINTNVRPQQQKLKRIPDTGFIVYETIAQIGQPSINILQVSAAKQGATVKNDVEVSSTEPNSLESVVRINNKVYGTASITAGKKEAKGQAFDKALEYARKIHYTIKQKSVHTVSVDVEQNGNGSKDSSKANAQGTQLASDNKGFKMMKMLGWSGGALGISGNGIEQPISIEMKVDRSGLGLTSDSTKLNYNFFNDYLTKYKTDETATYDLAFSKDFTKDERKTLHEIANRLGLKSRSHNGTDGSRHIVIFKKLELVDLANEILNEGLRSKCYELIAPTDPLPEQPKMFKKPQHNQQQKQQHFQQQRTNNIGFNYARQRAKPNAKPKRKKFF